MPATYLREKIRLMSDEKKKCTLTMPAKYLWMYWTIFKKTSWRNSDHQGTEHCYRNIHSLTVQSSLSNRPTYLEAIIRQGKLNLPRYSSCKNLWKGRHQTLRNRIFQLFVHTNCFVRSIFCPYSYSLNYCGSEHLCGRAAVRISNCGRAFVRTNIF